MRTDCQSCDTLCDSIISMRKDYGKIDISWYSGPKALECENGHKITERMVKNRDKQ